MNRTKLFTLAEMSTMIAGQEADLAKMETLEQKLGSSSAVAQAKRLVAIALVNQAAAMLKQAYGSVQYLTLEEKPTDEEGTPSQIEMKKVIADAMADHLGVAPEAILPFIVECNTVMLVHSDAMINQAKVLLIEADAAESLAA